MGSDPTDVRAFIALEIDPSTRARLAEAAAAPSPRLAGVRWSNPDTLHLTLRFLGPSSPAKLARLEEPLRVAAAVEGTAATVPFSGLGLFPDRGAPRVLWLGLALTDALVELQRACERAAVAAGFPRETRPFRSHLTVGRWRERAARPDLPDLELGSVRLDTLTLFRSQLSPKGATHTPLVSWRLR